MVRAPRLPRTGETLIGEEWWWKPGGKGGNQAMAAARAGAAVAMIGCLGDDSFGQRLRERLAAAGVGLDHVATVPRGSGMSVAIVEGDGDYGAVVVSGANRALDARQLRAAAPALGGCALLLLQNEIAEATNAAAARLARQAGARVILNAAPARPLDALAGLVDILVVNAVESEMLGAGRPDSLAAAAGCARRLQALAPVAVVTAGAHGAAAAEGEATLAIPAERVAQAETHGAGDVFVGTLAARLAEAAALEPALRAAVAAAARHVAAQAADAERR